jgi:predicted  nucleic acid-binding Zn-ribbon protein
MQKLRTQLRQLQGDETSLQLQLNDLTNQFTAPVSDENTRRQIQTRLGETQSRLNTVRSELDQTRKSVQAMEAQGPPTPGR